MSSLYKTERLEARLTRKQKAQITRAAALQGRKVTDFVVHALQEAAERTLKEHTLIELSSRDTEQFVKELMKPRRTNLALRRAEQSHKKLIRSS